MSSLSIVALSSWLCLFVAWASWALAFGGLAALQSSCASNTLNTVLSGVSSLSNSGTACSRFFSYQWFSVFFILVLLVLVSVCAFSSILFLALRTPMLPLFSVAIMLSMQGADTFVKIFEHRGISGSAQTQAGIAFAGFVMSAVVLCLLVIAFSASFEYRPSAPRPQNKGKQPVLPEKAPHEEIAVEPATETAQP